LNSPVISGMPASDMVEDSSENREEEKGFRN